MKNKKNEKGFTLVELLVVVTIMGLLGTIIAKNYTNYVNKSRVLVVEEQLNEIIKTFDMAFVESIDFAGTELNNFTDLMNFEDIKEVYETLSGNSLPERSTLTMEGTTITYTNDGKTATYSYA